MPICFNPPETLRLGAMLDEWKQRARSVRRDVRALYLARRDPRIPWYARLFAVAIVAYALSPIDLIPDFIPVLGYLDDLIIVPAGVLLLVKMIPANLLDEYRVKADDPNLSPAQSWIVAVIIVGLWACGLALAWHEVRRYVLR